MRSEKGITLTSLVIYVIVATIVIGAISMVSTSFFSNMNLVKDQNYYAPEYNKFNMFFIQDVKNNKNAEIEVTNSTEVSGSKITFEDGTVYEYNVSEKAIYRNDKKITEKLQNITFIKTEFKPTTNDHNTTKQIITVNLSIGEKDNFNKTIEYTLKYW